jgi:hypothetical protein
MSRKIRQNGRIVARKTIQVKVAVLLALFVFEFAQMMPIGIDVSYELLVSVDITFIQKCDSKRIFEKTCQACEASGFASNGSITIDSNNYVNGPTITLASATTSISKNSTNLVLYVPAAGNTRSLYHKTNFAGR